MTPTVKAIDDYIFSNHEWLTSLIFDIGPWSWGLFIASVFLIFVRKLTLKHIGLSIALYWLIILAMEHTKFPLAFTGDELLSRIPHELIAVMMAILVAMIVLTCCLVKRFRSVDRVVISLGICLIGVIFIAYHAFIFQGLLEKSLRQHEKMLMAYLLIQENSDHIEKAHNLAIIRGVAGKAPEVGDSFIDKQLSDYYNFYHKNYHSHGFAYSDSGVLAVEDVSYSYALKQQGDRYMMVIDTTIPRNKLRNHASIYSVICMMAVCFWTVLVGFVLYGHRRMR